MNFLSLFLLLVLPFNVVFLLHTANNQGNMGLYGVYLEIYRCRNIVYVSLLLLFISSFYGYVNYALLAFIACLYVFLRVISKWKQILLHNLLINTEYHDITNDNRENDNNDY